MSQHSTHEVWVIVSRESHSPSLSLAADEIFTTRLAAELELGRANRAFLDSPFRLGAATSGYSAMSLDEFLVAQRVAIAEELRVTEHNGYNRH